MTRYAGITVLFLAAVFIAAIVAAEEKTIEYFTCSMHPEVKAALPGDCPKCGMKLIPKYKAAEKKKDKISKDEGKKEDASKNLKKNPEKPVKAGDEVDYWTCSMHPSVHKDEPGKCPICGMTLIPVYKGDGGMIVIDERTRTLSGIISQKAENMTLYKTVNLPGRVVSDNELYLSEQEYLSSMENAKLKEGSRLRLSLFGFEEADIKNLEKEAMPDKTLIYPGEEAWVFADIYESDLKNVKRGINVELTVPAFPGEKFTGRIIAVEPMLDKMTRSAKARIKIKNPGGKLKFEMYADIVIKLELSSAVAVPTAAVINTGKRTLVYIEDSPGRFRMQEVTIGQEAESYTLVLSGLKEGDMVVVQGNFLLDSQSTLERGKSLQYEGSEDIKDNKKPAGKEKMPAGHRH